MTIAETLTITEPIVTDDFARPAIVLSAEDHARLSTLSHAARRRMPELSEELAAEIGRAEVLAAGEQPRGAVRMNGSVTFRDDTTGRVQSVTLVYPDEADIAQRKVSVLTPVGTALIGLRSGDTMRWETPQGELRRLTVLSVGEPAAA